MDLWRRFPAGALSAGSLPGLAAPGVDLGHTCRGDHHPSGRGAHRDGPYQRPGRKPDPIHRACRRILGSLPDRFKPLHQRLELKPPCLGNSKHTPNKDAREQGLLLKWLKRNACISTYF